jgi:hypothetical protein
MDKTLQNWLEWSFVHFRYFFWNDLTKYEIARAWTAMGAILVLLALASYLFIKAGISNEEELCVLGFCFLMAGACALLVVYLPVLIQPESAAFHHVLSDLGR